MAGRQLGRCAFPPEARGDDFRKWTLVMRTLFASSSALRGKRIQYIPDKQNVPKDAAQISQNEEQKPLSGSDSSSTKPDKVRIPSSESRLTRATPGVRRLGRSMDRNAVYHSGKMPLPLPTMPAPIPYPPVPPPSPARRRSTLSSDRLNGLADAAGCSVAYIPYLPSPQERLWNRNQMSTFRSV